jgi:hypothetical protein
MTYPSPILGNEPNTYCDLQVIPHHKLNHLLEGLELTRVG